MGSGHPGVGALMGAAALLFLVRLVAPLFRADQVISQGVEDLRDATATATEWKRVSFGQSGQWGISAERAVLAGMLSHVERARAASPYRNVQIIHEPRETT